MWARSAVSGKLRANLRKSVGVMRDLRFTKSAMTAQMFAASNGLLGARQVVSVNKVPGCRAQCVRRAAGAHPWHTAMHGK